MHIEQLTGPRVILRALRSSDAPALVAAAADGELWNLPFTVDRYLRNALDGHAAGSVMPFVTVLAATGTVIGSTRFWKIDPHNRKLEIGSTWIAASHQKSFVNTEAKYLMLRAAFEGMGCIRVQFTTDEINTRSRAAILRLGAKEEGIIRFERIMPNGRKRNSVRFSIIEDEWPEVKSRVGPVNTMDGSANVVKKPPIKARDDGQACAWPRKATRSGGFLTTGPKGCGPKDQPHRCKALPGFTPAAFCASPLALWTRNAPPIHRVNRP